MNSNTILDDLLYDLEDEDQQFDDILDMPVNDEPPMKKRRKFKQLELETLSDKKCKSKFRFTYNEIARMCSIMKLEPVIDFNGIKLDNRTALAMLLYSYSTYRTHDDIEDFFGISTSNISRILSGMGDRLIDMFYYGLQFDERQFSLENCERFSNAIVKRGSYYENIVGFIDGTMQQICRPKDADDQKNMYNGWKSIHCDKFQAISTPDGITSSLCGPYVGRRNDRGMLNESEMLSRITSHFRRLPTETKYAIYGDQAYSSTDHLISPFTKPLSELEEETNKSMAKVRVAVEMEFGKVAQYFSACKWKYANKVGKTKPAQKYILCTLFKNFHTCINGSAVSAMFKLKPPTLEEYINGLMRPRNSNDFLLTEE